MRRRKQLKCPFDSEEALEAKGKNAKAKGPYDQSTQSLTSLSTLEDGNDVACAVEERSETRIKLSRRTPQRTRQLFHLEARSLSVYRFPNMQS